jgi:hypothetical protein
MGFTPYTTELDRVLRSPGGPVGRHMNIVARSVASEAGRIAIERGLVRTGRYARGFKVEVSPDPQSGFYFTVVNRVVGQKPRRGQSYADVIERGSRPHPIRPRKASGWLIFRMPDGRIIKTKLVNHPGTAPQNVMRDALDRVSRTL